MSELLFNFTGTEAKKGTGLANILIQSASSNISFSRSDFAAHRSTVSVQAIPLYGSIIYLLISSITWELHSWILKILSSNASSATL